MPGIFGFTHHQRNDNNFHLLENMANALIDGENYQDFQHHEELISLGRVGTRYFQPDTQPAWNQNECVAVILEGEVYDYADHQNELIRRGYQFKSNSHAELFAHLYDEFGPEFVKNINGAFSTAIWDKIRHELFLITDHLGLQPLYYSSFTKNGLIFASGVRSILAHKDIPRKIDHLALAQLLTFDHALDDHTLLDDIKLLPGGTILSFANNQLTFQNYWRPQYPSHYPVRSYAEYYEEFGPIIKRAVKRQIPEEESAAVLMSGGLDSRVVVGFLHDHLVNGNLQTITMGQPSCDDERFAKDVSRALGVPHTFYQLKGDYLLNYAERGVRISDGMGNIVHMHTLPVVNKHHLSARIFYKGFLGDALIGYGIDERHFAKYSDSDISDAQFAIHKDQGLILFTPETLDKLMMTQDVEPISQRVRASYSNSFKAANTDSPADQRNYFDLCQRVPRMTLNGVLWVRSQVPVRLPFAERLWGSMRYRTSVWSVPRTL
ncbi:asparagine synthetase B family protein [Chloroflexota bacterium]